MQAANPGDVCGANAGLQVDRCRSAVTLTVTAGIIILSHAYLLNRLAGQALGASCCSALGRYRCICTNGDSRTRMSVGQHQK